MQITKLFTRRLTWRLAGVAVACLVAASALAETRYVSLDGFHQDPFTNWSMAATNLAAAELWSATANGDTIIVSNGVYCPTATITPSKSVIITSLCGAAETIIEGGGRALRGIQQTAAVTSTIYGLTVTNWFGGGINLEASLAISLSNSVTLVNCVITGNRANDGAGIRVYRGTLTVSNCVIRGNEATYNVYAGGGISFLLAANTGTLINCEISGNSAPNGYGGGIMAGSPITIRNCTIAGNSALQGGGGIYQLVAGTRISNCRIIGNTVGNSSGGGGGIDAQAGGAPIVESSLICSNNGDMGGGAQRATLVNCTVASNAGRRAGGTRACMAVNSIVYYNAAGPGYESYSNYYSGETGWTNCNTAPSLGVNCIAADPQFAGPASRDYHLRKGSPCINTGLYQGWMAGAVDLDGRPRIRLGAVDMGAYEYFPQGAVVTFR